jgi:hypothetical protein
MVEAAGYDPTGSGVPGITVAERAFIEFTMDFNEDGDVDDNEERIRYYLSNDADGDGIADDIDAPSSPSHLLREHWDGDSWEPVSDDEKIIAENIDALNFVYLDGDGTDSLTDYLNLDPPAVPAAAPDLRGEIRSVQITIVARGGANIQVLPDKEVDSNVYMNQQIRPGDDWDIVLPAQNDLFRRNLLSAEVRCRNLGLEVN